MSSSRIDRRTWFRGLFGGSAALGLSAAWGAQRTDAAQVGPKDNIKVTKIDTFVLTNSWVFVKISTDAGITGWGEMLKDDAKACAAGALEVGDYLIGQDPLRVVHPLAGDSSRRVLPRRTDQDRDLERDRSGACGTSPARPTVCPSTS